MDIIVEFLEGDIVGMDGPVFYDVNISTRVIRVKSDAVRNDLENQVHIP